MNTSQLTVLWYGGLVTCLFLWEMRRLPGTGLGKVLAIILFTGILIYTLGSHPKAKKKWVLFNVLFPLIVGISVRVGWMQYEKFLNQKGCASAVEMIAAEQVGAEREVEGLGKKWKRALSSRKNSTVSHSAIIRKFKGTLTKTFEGYKKCRPSEQQRIAENWVNKYWRN